jgi:hypothetical protein
VLKIVSMSEKPHDDIATKIMAVMVRMPPKQHKAAPKPQTPKGTAQRRRRENERQQAIEASDGD